MTPKTSTGFWWYVPEVDRKVHKSWVTSKWFLKHVDTLGTTPWIKSENVFSLLTSLLTCQHPVMLRKVTITLTSISTIRFLALELHRNEIISCVFVWVRSVLRHHVCDVHPCWGCNKFTLSHCHVAGPQGEHHGSRINSPWGTYGLFPVWGH